MKILQVVPKPDIDSKLKTLLKNTERNLRGPHTTFHREREGRRHAHGGTIEALASTLLTLSPEDRALLAALLVGK
jgi:hypothetical protein